MYCIVVVITWGLTECPLGLKQALLSLHACYEFMLTLSHTKSKRGNQVLKGSYWLICIHQYAYLGFQCETLTI
jgi:hypothetical protein